MTVGTSRNNQSNMGQDFTAEGNMYFLGRGRYYKGANAVETRMVYYDLNGTGNTDVNGWDVQVLWRHAPRFGFGWYGGIGVYHDRVRPFGGSVSTAKGAGVPLGLSYAWDNLVLTLEFEPRVVANGVYERLIPGNGPIALSSGSTQLALRI